MFCVYFTWKCESFHQNKNGFRIDLRLLLEGSGVWLSARVLAPWVQGPEFKFYHWKKKKKKGQGKPLLENQI